MSHSKFYHPNCLNCHYPLAEFDKFCPNCGQKPIAPKSTMHDLWHEFIHTFFHLDGKFFSTLTHLFLPGKLTEEYFKGHHKRYAHPIQLFLVLGGVFLLVMLSVTGKAEKEFEKNLEDKKTARQMKRVFVHLDSLAQQMPAYQKDSAVKNNIDALLEKQFVMDEKENILVTEYIDIKDDLFWQRLKLSYFQQHFPIDSMQSDSKALAIVYTYYQKTYARFEKDSAMAVVQFGESFRLKPSQAADSLEALIADKDAIKKLKGTHEDAAEWLKDRQDKVVDRVKADVDEAKSGAISLTGFMRGVQEASDSSRMQKRNKIIGQVSSKTKRLRETDSVNIFFTNIQIAENDLTGLDAEEIAKKYKIDNTWHKHLLKRKIELREAGASKLHAFFSKSLWVLIFSLLPMAGFMYLMYRRRKHYFSEHLVWLLHFNSLLFILSPLLWLGDSVDNEILVHCLLWPFVLTVLIAPFIALKRYYKQSWVKTIIKGLLFEFVYLIVGSIAFVIGMAVSFLFL